MRRRSRCRRPGRRRCPGGGTPRSRPGRSLDGDFGDVRSRVPRLPPRAFGGSFHGTMARVSALEEVTPFATVEEAIEDIRQGRFVVVVDAADRENEGDLTIAAQFATPEAINFMTKEARGLICLCLSEQRCDDLGLRQMTDKHETPHGTATTASVEPREAR